MNAQLEEKLKTLPASPGVYFHKSKTGEIIYVGKAAVLKNRVRQYFQNSRGFDNKTMALVNEIDDTDWVETESEIDALFLESEMVKRYKPRYNVLLRDDKSQLYVRITMKDEFPVVGYTRAPIDDGAEYFGPFYNGYALKKSLRYLRRIFPYFISTPNKERKSLDSHIGLEPINSTSEEYKAQLRSLISYIRGNRTKIIKDFEQQMKDAAMKQDFEQAAELRNKLQNLKELKRRITFGDKEFQDMSKDQALLELQQLLGLESVPKRIEGYDISHMSGTNVVASMVVFRNGVSDRASYRKFKVFEKNDDFENMATVITRRFSERNLTSWGKPNLVLIDGGKGQLQAALESLRGNPHAEKIVVIGLAKREEQIVVQNKLSNVNIDRQKVKDIGGVFHYSEDFTLIDIPNNSNTIKLLQRIRNESHRFAVSYHSALKRQKSTKSVLEDIPGIGPKTQSLLVKKFGSVRGIRNASEEELASCVGNSKAKALFSYLRAL